MAEVSAPHSPTILIVEDNHDIATLLVILVKADFAPDHIYRAETLRLALHILQAVQIDLMFIDPSLPDSDGYRTIRTLMDAAPLVPTAVLTGYPVQAHQVRALADGARGYYDKYEVIRDWHKVNLVKQLLAEAKHDGESSPGD